jgi:hypothetical protein
MHANPSTSSPVTHDKLLEFIRRTDRPDISLENACWLVWAQEPKSGMSAAMSSAQFIHFNAPVLAVQRNGRMEYFGENGELGWTSNLSWPRGNLEMMRLPARVNFPEENPPEEDSADENASGQDASGA